MVYVASVHFENVRPEEDDNVCSVHGVSCHDAIVSKSLTSTYLGCMRVRGGHCRRSGRDDRHAASRSHRLCTLCTRTSNGARIVWLHCTACRPRSHILTWCRKISLASCSSSPRSERISGNRWSGSRGGSGSCPIYVAYHVARVRRTFNWPYINSKPGRRRAASRRRGPSRHRAPARRAACHSVGAGVDPARRTLPWRTLTARVVCVSAFQGKHTL